jgi:cytochrome c-type biogenesis protein CcmF
MSMIGTFLVRSGILTSVHSFAVDPTRGSFILGLLIFYTGGALLLFALRIASIREGARFEPVSREGALVANNLILSVILGTVFVGTLYPVMVEAVSGEKISVGPPYFNAVTGPLVLILAVLLFIGPLLRWRRDSRPNLRRVAVPAVATAGAFALTFIDPAMNMLPRLGLAFAAGLAVASFLPLAGRDLRRTPLTIWGMVISHLGIAVAMIGAASDASLTRETLAAARVGDVLMVGPWKVRFNGVDPVAGPNWTAIEGHLVPPTETNEAAITTRLDGQLYTVLGRRDGDRWQLRLWWKPMVTFIWLGGALIALGGLLALIGRLRRERGRPLAAAEART